MHGEQVGAGMDGSGGDMTEGPPPPPWLPWRLAAGLSLALSLGVLALVQLMAYRGGGVEASPFSQPNPLSIERASPSLCEYLSQSDPNYDPEMGCFSVSCPSCPISTTVYSWNRSPFLTDTHEFGPLPYNDFLWTLHRNKGCGDFQIRASMDATNVTAFNPFNIPCSESLANDTISSTFVPEPGNLFCGPGDCPFPTLFTEQPVFLTLTSLNRTATWMQAQLDDVLETSPLGFPWISLPVVEPAAIPPGGSADFRATVQPNWPGESQQDRVAAASSTRVTATFVYSFGPTARISQTLILARPQRANVPFAPNDWGGGW